jgi:hypothetical protein
VYEPETAKGEARLKIERHTHNYRTVGHATEQNRLPLMMGGTVRTRYMTTGHRDLVGESETEEGQNNIIDGVQTVPEKKRSWRVAGEHLFVCPFSVFVRLSSFRSIFPDWESVFGGGLRNVLYIPTVLPPGRMKQ